MTENTSAVAAFFTALAKAQGQIEAAKKDSANPFFKSKYADLSSAWSACRQALSENGLSVIQFPKYKPDTGMVSIETVLGHAGGHAISDVLDVPVTKKDAQAIGSAISYGRRYALMSVVGISADDDDGESSFGRGEWKKNAERQAEEVGNRMAGGAVKDTVKNTAKDPLATFKSKVDDLAMKEGAIAVEEFWRADETQAKFAKRSEAIRDEAQAYVEDAIEALMPKAEAAE